MGSVDVSFGRSANELTLTYINIFQRQYCYHYNTFVLFLLLLLRNLRDAGMITMTKDGEQVMPRSHEMSRPDPIFTATLGRSGVNRGKISPEMNTQEISGIVVTTNRKPRASYGKW